MPGHADSNAPGIVCQRCYVTIYGSTERQDIGRCSGSVSHVFVALGMCTKSYIAPSLCVHLASVAEQCPGVTAQNNSTYKTGLLYAIVTQAPPIFPSFPPRNAPTAVLTAQPWCAVHQTATLPGHHRDPPSLRGGTHHPASPPLIHLQVCLGDDDSLRHRLLENQVLYLIPRPLRRSVHIPLVDTVRPLRADVRH